VGEFDVFTSRAGEVVSADVDPSICDVINVREDVLIDHHLVRPARVANRIDRALAGGSGRRDAHINRINAPLRVLREVPLRAAGGRAGTRS